MPSLLLTILSTTAIGVVIKIAETHVKERLTMLFANYVAASLVSAVLWVHAGAILSISTPASIMAPIGGFIFAGNFFLMILAIKKRGVALTVTLMRLSAIVPVTASIILFADSPSNIQIAGAVGALIAAALLSVGVKGGEEALGGIRTSAIILILTSIGLLICFGSADLIMKLFERLGNPGEKSLFLAMLFGFAALFVLVAILLRGVGITLADFGWGIMLGIPNLFASYFLVSALSVFPAYIVFPTVAAGTVMLITVIAIAGFKERLTYLGAIGIFLTFASILALNR